MAYRRDNDLEFLAKVPTDDLKPLVEILTNGKYTFNQNLDKRDPKDPAYWTYVAEQIQLYGGDTIMNMFRLGDGVLYREVLTDVCDKYKITYKKEDIVADIEKRLVRKIFSESWEKLNQEQKREILISAKVPCTTSMLALGGGLVVSSLVTAGSQIGYFLMKDFIYSIIVSLVGRTAITFGLSRAVTIWAGPIGIAVSAIWAFSGTAYRVTIPACLTVAMLRQQMGLTTEDIIRQKKQRDREKAIDIILSNIINSQKRTIYLYIFAYKILELKDVALEYDDILRGQIFGMTEVYIHNKKMIIENIQSEDFASIIKLNIINGNRKNDLKSILDYWLTSIDSLPKGVITKDIHDSISNEKIVELFNNITNRFDVIY